MVERLEEESMIIKRISRLLKIILLLLLIGLILYLFMMKKEIDQVVRWRPVVEAAAEKDGIKEYSDMVLAIILTETKGKHLDLMQSSESQYGSQDQIETSEESIDLGVAHLAQMINQAKEEKADVWTAVQAYNFGPAYISYIADHGDKNTLKLAEQYSQEYLAPSLGNEHSEKYRYLHPLAFVYNGGYLYRDGGNFFYAKIVQYNYHLIKFFNLF